jgi:3-mercaptopyruvate sulfurtransferase SseA
MLQGAGVANVRALVGGWAKWVRETNQIVKGDNPK